MSNIEHRHCEVCKRTTPFYNVENDTWECKECGHTIYEDAFDEEFETDGSFEDGTDDNFEDSGFDNIDEDFGNDDTDENFDKKFDVKGTF